MRSSPNRLSFVRFGDMSLPFARGELFRTLAAVLPRPRVQNPANFAAGISRYAPFLQQTKKGVFLRNLLKITRIRGRVNFSWAKMRCKRGTFLGIVPIKPHRPMGQCGMSIMAPPKAPNLPGQEMGLLFTHCWLRPERNQIGRKRRILKTFRIPDAIKRADRLSIRPALIVNAKTTRYASIPRRHSRVRSPLASWNSPC